MFIFDDDGDGDDSCGVMMMILMKVDCLTDG